MAAEPVIAVSKLTKVYPGDLTAVDHISFSVDKGDIFALLGPNGAGKTTTVEMIEGLRKPTSGAIRVLGHDISRGYARIRARVGVVPQDFTPMDRLKAPEAVQYFGALFGRKYSKSEAMELVKTVGLEHRANTLAKKLSGGEKRRIGIAMALVGDPEVLFLDEPTTGLDPQARRVMWGLLRDLQAQGKTMVLTTHYLEEAEKLSNDVAVMHKGQIVARGTPTSLIAEYGGGTSILLREPGAGAQATLDRLGFPFTSENGGLRIQLGVGASVRGAIQRLEGSGIQFDDLITIEPTLEDTFLNLIGGRMEDGVLKE